MKFQLEAFPESLQLKYTGSHFAGKGEALVTLTRPSAKTLRLSLNVLVKLFPIPKKIVDYHAESIWEHMPADGIDVTQASQKFKNWTLLGFHDHDRLRGVRHLWERDLNSESLLYSKRENGKLTVGPEKIEVGEEIARLYDPLALVFAAGTITNETVRTVFGKHLAQLRFHESADLELEHIQLSDRAIPLQPPIKIQRNESSGIIERVTVQAFKGLRTFTLSLHK